MKPRLGKVNEHRAAGADHLGPPAARDNQRGVGAYADTPFYRQLAHDLQARGESSMREVMLVNKPVSGQQAKTGVQRLVRQPVAQRRGGTDAGGKDKPADVGAGDHAATGMHFTDCLQHGGRRAARFIERPGNVLRCAASEKNAVGAPDPGQQGFVAHGPAAINPDGLRLGRNRD